MPDHITGKEFEEFEKWFLLVKIRYPEYRYGQAFLNYFNGIDSLSMNSSKVMKESNTFELFIEKDIFKARELVLRYVKEDN